MDRKNIIKRSYKKLNIDAKEIEKLSNECFYENDDYKIIKKVFIELAKE
ncbi:hypothetical protein [Malacoplasma iowae]|nr:hypothetical protein QX181_04925 [Malacoplasma iowae]